MIQLCLIQVLDLEAQEHIKDKKVLECKECPVKENCAKWVKENENTSRN